MRRWERAPARRRRRRSRHALERHHLAHFSLKRIRAANASDVRYGRNAIPEDMTIQDWGVTYDDLEPHLIASRSCAAHRERPVICAARRSDGGNLFEGPRGNDYPNKPLIMSQAGLIFTEAAKSLGYASVPDAVLEFQRGLYQSRGHDASAQCQYCGHCEFSAASPMPKQARTSASCRHCCRIRDSSCGRTPM